MNPANSIVQLEEVGWNPPIAALWDTGIEGASLHLRRGEIAIIHLESGRPRHPLPDLICGAQIPDVGTVRLLGEDWAGLSADRAAARRGRIGQVFRGAGCLSNLDLDENITLPLRYHDRLSHTAAREKALEWARFFGLADLPAGRPVLASRETLKLSQWIRAFAGKPDLLLLDQPAEGLPPARVRRLCEAIIQECARGAAALWLTAEAPRLTASIYLECQGKKLEPWIPNPGDSV